MVVRTPRGFLLLVMLLVSALLLGCHAEKTTRVDVSLREWSVTPSVAQLKQGKVSFVAKNDGLRLHDLVVIKTDLPPNQLPLLDGAVDEDKLHVVGKTEQFAPSTTKELTVGLSPGKYLLLCNVVEQPAGGPAVSHFDEGMVTSLLVTP